MTAPIGGALTVNAGARQQVSYVLGSGGDLTRSLTLQSGGPMFQVEGRVTFEMQLVLPKGGVALPSTTSPLHAGADGEGRTAYPVVFRVPSRAVLEGVVEAVPRSLPPEMVRLRSLGISTTTLRVDGAEPLYDMAGRWLREHGFLPSGTSGRWTGVATRARWLANARALDHARSAQTLRGAADELVEGGHTIWLEVPGTGDVQRVQVRLTAERIDDAPVTAARSLPGLQTNNWSGYNRPGQEGRKVTPMGWSLTGMGEVSNPLEFHGQLPLQGVRPEYTASGSNAEATATTSLVGQEKYLSAAGDGLQLFEIPVRLRLDLLWSHGPAPRPLVAEGTLAVAVPTYRTVSAPPRAESASDAPVAVVQEPVAPEPSIRSDEAAHGSEDARSGHPGAEDSESETSDTESVDSVITDEPHIAVRVTEEELTRLAGDGAPEVLRRLPESAFVDRVLGSDTLVQVVSRLLGAPRTETEDEDLFDLTALHRQEETADEDAEAVAAPSAERTGDLVAETAATPPAEATAGHVPETAVAPPAATETAAAPPVKTPAEIWASAGAGGPLGWAQRLADGAWRWTTRTTVGGSLADQDSMAQQVLRSALSFHQLTANALTVFGDGLVLEGAGSFGLVSGTDVSVEITGYLSGVRRQEAPGPMSMESWLYASDTVTSTRSVGGGGQTGVTVSGAYTPGVSLFPSGRYVDTSATTVSTTHSDNASDARVTAHSSTRMQRFTADATYRVTVGQGRRNVVSGTLAARPHTVRTVGFLVPDAVEFLLPESDLAKHPELAALAEFTPPAQDRTLMLPQWYRDTGQLGQGAVIGVALEGPRGQFRQNLLDTIEKAAPGATRPGDAGYLPGLASWVSDHSSSVGLRVPIGAGPRGTGSMHFVHRGWLGLGPRLVTVEVNARPRPGTDLDQIRGSGVDDTAQLTHSAAHGGGRNAGLAEPGVQTQSVSYNRARQLEARPVLQSGGQRLQTTLTGALERAIGTSATSQRETRAWQRSGELAEFQVPYRYRVTVRSSPMSGAADGPVAGLVAATLGGFGTREFHATADATATLWFDRDDLPTEADRAVPLVRPAVFERDPADRTAPPPGALVIGLDGLTDDVRDALDGQDWMPDRPFALYSFDAGVELARALREVDPALSGPDRMHTSFSDESLMIRLSRLVRPGDGDAGRRLDSVAVGRLMGRTGAHPATSVRLRLLPQQILATGDTALDDVRTSGDAYTTTATTTVTPSVASLYTARVTSDDTNRVLVSAPFAQNAGAQGQSGGGNNYRRDYLKYGLPARAGKPGPTTGHLIRALAVLHVTGPKENRWVLGTMVLRAMDTPPLRTIPAATGTPAATKTQAATETPAATDGKAPGSTAASAEQRGKGKAAERSADHPERVQDTEPGTEPDTAERPTTERGTTEPGTTEPDAAELDTEDVRRLAERLGVPDDTVRALAGSAWRHLAAPWRSAGNRRCRRGWRHGGPPWRGSSKPCTPRAPRPPVISPTGWPRTTPGCVPWG